MFSASQWPKFAKFDPFLQKSLKKQVLHTQRFSKRNVQQKQACPMLENPARFREHMDIRFANVLFKMWKLQAKTRLHPLQCHLEEYMCNFWYGSTVLFYLYHINLKALSIIVWLKLIFVVYLVIHHAHIDQSWPPSRYGLRIGPTSYRPNFVKIGVAVQERCKLPIFLAPPSGQNSPNSAHPFPVSWQPK